MDISLLLSIIIIHFISDFVFQNDFMAINKSKNAWVLMLHCIVYSIPFLVFGLEYAAIAGGLHFIVDFFTSKLTTYLWIKNERHWFFVAVGFDQAIHMICLILTADYIRLMF